jgi:ubiquinone/menaquinone biosynthesis C-methylase UbiE
MGTKSPDSEHAQRAARTYGAAADHFDDPALGFWDRYGAATVARLPLVPGQRVLDLCCGTGASAIPAARAVGPSGQVTGVDVAEPLLALARDRRIVLGSGYRATADALCPAQQARVRDRVVTELRSRSVTAITTNVVYGTAAKPGS